MRTQIKRLMAVLVLASASLAIVAPASPLSAGEHDRPLIRTGVFNGLWHGDKVQIVVLRVNGDGSFTGDIHFDPNGRWGDVRCGFTARLGNNDSLTMTRDDCPQTALTGRPDRHGNTIVWRGSIALDNVRHPFELRIPAWR